MPHNILFLDQFGTMGGAQRVLREVVQALDPARYQPILAINGGGEFRESLEASRKPVVDLPLGDYHSGRKTVLDKLRFTVRTLYCSLILMRAIVSRDIDLLYANGPRTFFCAVLSGWIMRRPVIWHLHNVLSPGVELRLLVFFSRWVRWIIVCSKAVSSPLLDRCSELQSRIKLIYNPAPQWDLPTMHNDSELLRKDLHLKPGFLSFGVLGRITPFKGQLEFIAAAQLVLRKHVSAYFLVIGSPAEDNPEDQTYFESIQQYVRAQGLSSSILFISHQKQVQRYYGLLDVVVLASQEPEALPQTLIEAMSMGKVVIAPSGGGVPEIVEDGINGFLVERAESASLAAKMLELVHNPEMRTAARLKAKEMAGNRFSPVRFREETLTILAQCLKENN